MDGGVRRSLTVALLGVRLLAELGLVVTPLVVALSTLAPPVGVVAGLVGSAALTLVWGTFLSPRRRVDGPMGARVVLELLLMAGAVCGLATTGHGAGAAALGAAELVSLGGLLALGVPPGSDVAAGTR